MNKSTKIWTNYTLGIAISGFLLWNIYAQVIKHPMALSAWRLAAPNMYLWSCIALMFVNTSLEGYKWYWLAGSVEPVRYSRAFSSYLAGVAFSIITPNRIGEYPGRILYMGRGNTFRYVNVAVLGVSAQLLSIYILGVIGLVYYNLFYPGTMAGVALTFCVISIALMTVLYWRFEVWLPAFARIRWLKRFALYGKLLNRVTARQQIIILVISLVRVFIFTAQYLFLLRWMNVSMPATEGFCMAALFFWVMAVIPSVALTELGIRGEVSLFLFQHFPNADTVGILSATAGIWLINLVVPSIIGSILILRLRLLR